MITIEKSVCTAYTAYVLCILCHGERTSGAFVLWKADSCTADRNDGKRAFLPGNTIAYDSSFENLSLEDCCLEMSSYGKGDIREPFIETEYADGSTTADFCLRAHRFPKQNAACRHFRVHMMKTANPNS